MLHELLLALSGHESTLLKSERRVSNVERLLSPSESTLLKQIALLGSLRDEIRVRADHVCSDHPSIICKAVSSAIISTHLAKFQEKILSVEESILTKDSLIVGAYDIVPLSSVAASFDGWSHILAWLKELLLFLQISDGRIAGNLSGRRSGAQVINWLRQESQTGYPDLAEIALNLVKIAESAWLRQISSWLLCGRIPALGGDDFFVQCTGGAGSSRPPAYSIRHDLAPDFVSHSTAKSILFVGKSINQIQDRASGLLAEGEISSSGIGSLQSANLVNLSKLQPPITSPGLSRAVNEIRSSLAVNALQQLLPVSSIIQTISVFQSFLLLGRGEFAVSLIGAADDCLAGRRLHSSSQTCHQDAQQLRGIMIKEGELRAVLTRTWTTLAALRGNDEEDVDDELEMARDLIQLTIRKPNSSKGKAAPEPSFGTLEAISGTGALFEDVLLGTPVAFNFAIRGPLDLFLTSAETNVYSCLNSYLLSIRRAHMHLTELWRITVFRRTHLAPALASTKQASNATIEARVRAQVRSRAMRGIWAIISSATFLLAELGEYLQGEVVAGSWESFRAWIQPSSTSSAPRPKTTIDHSDFNSSSDSRAEQALLSGFCHDPEVLTTAHRQYLAALIHQSLLADAPFTKALRALIICIDQLVALIQRLETVVNTLQTEAVTNNPPTVYAHLAHEEGELLRSLHEVRRNVEKCLRNLVLRLTEIDEEQMSGRIGLDEEEDRVATEFVPWKGPGVNRLLVKLDFGRIESVCDKSTSSLVAVES